MGPRVVVALSGGVDSSVSAYLLKQAGYEVIGVSMRLATQEDPEALPAQRRCCGVEDVDDARRVCQVLGVPHYNLNFEKQFKAQVVDYFIREYQRGRTPHPCIACNDKIKFDFLLQRAMAWDAEFIATGHYARVIYADGSYRLLKSKDAAKDQSYVLYTLRQEQLQRLLFPVGELTKPEVRRLAADLGLAVADKPDSQEICFVPSGNYREFLAGHLDSRPGDILSTSGEVLGHHPGVAFFTVGQRRGLGLALGKPHFVTHLDPERNLVVVGADQALWDDSCLASDVTFVAGQPPSGPVTVTAKIRYKSPETEAVLNPMGDGWAEIHFLEPQRAVTPGQAIVFYRGEEVLGGGLIASGPVEAPGPQSPPSKVTSATPP